MFRKLIKKFKKINLYVRIAIVYCIFLIIKWFMYEMVGIEIGKEGMKTEQNNLATSIGSNARLLAESCSKNQSGSSSSAEIKSLKAQISKLQNENKLQTEKLAKQLSKNNSTCPKCKVCPSCILQNN